ncbi:MAG: hypothetical protein LPK09_04905 [Hymenobacteraceae bacterium]|nr:hypothetical protein [Hymenobacteraceae bacterium]
MKLKLVIVLLLKFGFAIGQDSNYPILSTKGGKIQDFIPKGWVLLDSVNGDLNKDGFADKAFIIDSNEEQNSNEQSVNKRTLVVVFYDTTAKHFNLIEQTSNLFSSLINKPNLFYEVMEINKGTLAVTFMHAGSYPTIYDYKFRYQNNVFYLIGADKRYSKPSAYENYSFNFLSKKWSLTTGNDNSDESPVTVWKKLELPELKTLKNFGGPNSWKIAEGIYL